METNKTINRSENIFFIGGYANILRATFTELNEST